MTFAQIYFLSSRYHFFEEESSSGLTKSANIDIGIHLDLVVVSSTSITPQQQSSQIPVLLSSFRLMPDE